MAHTSTTKKIIENLFELSPEALFLEDSEGNVLDVNQEACEMLGYEKEELLGQDVDQIVPEYAPVYLPGEIDEATRAGKPIETTNIRKDGTEIPVELRGRIIGVKGEERVLVSIRDIGERKEAEQTLQDQRRRLQERNKELRVLYGISKLFSQETETLPDLLQKTADLLPSGWQYPKAAAAKITHRGKEYKTESYRSTPWSQTAELKKEGETIGTLEVCYLEEKPQKDEGPFLSQERKLIDHLASHLTRLISSRETKQSLAEQRQKLKNLHAAVDLLQKQDTEEEILQAAIEVAENMLDFRFCDISLVEGDYLVPKASATGLDPEESVPFEMGEGITGKTMQKGETIWGEDVRKHPDAKPTSGDFRAFISVPIGEMGIFQVISEEEGSFTERDVELTEILVGHLREELTRIRLEEDLRQQAIRDPLTGLYNRRYFNETLKKEVQKAERYERPLAFLMVDVNRFKEVNDCYTHQVGDEVLKEVANLLKKDIRDADTVVRYGGDEFLIMMPETKGELKNVTERLKENLARWNEKNDLLDFQLTLAMGVSYWGPDQDRDVEEALKEADRKMYKDKRDNS